MPQLGYAGLVVQTMDAGHVPARYVEPLARLAQAVPAVLASRAASGQTCNVKGLEMDLIKHRLIPAGWLTLHKA